MSKEKDLRQRTTGRGAPDNASGRFESIQHVADLSDYGWLDPEDATLLKTQFLVDSSKTIVTENKSPDIGFAYSVNAYRGCEHGCSYCYARPTHEYLGHSAGLDFESKIYVKEKAPELLREKLMSRSWKGDLIVMSGITDCYQPAEQRFQLTRKCLEVLADFRNPVGIITKNQLVVRDIDIFQELAKYNAISVCLSVTSLNTDLARILEPRTASPQARLKAIEKLALAGIPVSANIAPVIPGLTDHEMPAIIKAAADAGATSIGYTPLRLPFSVSQIFSDWLEQHYPDRKDKVINMIKSLRGGKLNDPNFETRMQGEGEIAKRLSDVFDLFVRKYKMNVRSHSLSSEHFRKPTAQQSFFD